MELQVSPELDRLFYQTLLCEVTTIDREGFPITTPMQHLWDPDRGIFVLSSALGVRFKLDRIARNSHVALSFSEFHGSGLDGPPDVLVRGTARITDPVTHVAGLEDFWSSNLRKKPDQRAAAFDENLRSEPMSLFYIRARIEVTPESITVLDHHGREVA